MHLPSLLSLLLLLLSPTIRAAVLAIDYGAEFTKLSLVKPGVPLDVVLDKDSKRKIQSVVGWKREDRVFGQEGKMAATRFPHTHYPYVKPLLGSTTIPPLPIYPNPPILSADGELVFKHPFRDHPDASSDGRPQDEWTPTALLAHQISYYRSLAEALTDSKNPESITSVIVTVPAWWNQYQRKAYRDALELQGLSCLSMIGEGTGVALNYAMTRGFPDYDPETGVGAKEYHLIYDSGAMSTTATVVAFWQTSVLPTPKAKTAINTTHIEIMGTGHTEIGGVALDVAIQQLLLKDFIKKSGKTAVEEDQRALAKLAKEANRVKHILSANQESNVNVESLFDDIDYKSRFSRTDLESALSESGSLFSTPIASALSTANLGLDQLTSVILFGGNTRVPLVQSAVKDVLGDAQSDKIAQNVNTDEAAVLGAAYYGASLSRQFKMKSIEVHEVSTEEFRLNGEVFFPRGAQLGQKKSIELPVQDEVRLEFTEGDNPVLAVELLNVPSVRANFTGPSPIINITMRLDSRGHLSAANAVLVSNSTIEAGGESGGVAGALKGLFGKKDKEDNEPEEDESAGDQDSEKEKDKNEKKTDKKDKKERKKSKAKGPEKAALRFKEDHLGVKHLTKLEKHQVAQRLTAIKTFEAAKTAREEARNILEGYLYKLANLLDPQTDRRALIDFSTEAERDVIAKAVTESFDWIGEHAETASEKELVEKRRSLEKLEAPIVVRFTETQTRGKAVEDFQQAMFAARSFFVEAQKNNTEAIEAGKAATPEKPVAPPKYTEEELKMVEGMLKDNEVWMDERMAKQVKIENDPTKDPEIMTKDLNERGKRLQMTVLRLVNKKAPKAPKPVTASSSSTSSATESESTGSSTTAGTEAEEETGVPKHEEL